MSGENEEIHSNYSKSLKKRFRDHFLRGLDKLGLLRRVLQVEFKSSSLRIVGIIF